MIPTIDRPLKLKPVFLLLSIGLCGSAGAVGLGEIVVRSYLGQPLNAAIELLDAPQGLEAGCFSLSREDGTRLPSAGDARIRLERNRSGTHLVITTSRAINDPVMQFAVATECRGSLRRDYVVLLDPPPMNIHASAIVVDASSVDSAVVSGERGLSSEDSRPSPHPSGEKNLIHPASPDARARVAHPRAKVRPARTGTVSRAAGADSSQPVSPRRQAGKSPGPRLILSGKPHPQAGAMDASAAVQKNIARQNAAPPPKQAPPAPELSDDATAVAHHLDNLELRLAALKKRNAELDVLLRAPPPAPAATRNPDQHDRLSLYLLGLSLFTGGAALALWLKRRQPPHAQEADSQQWPLTTPSDDEPSQTPTTATPHPTRPAIGNTPIPPAPKLQYPEGTELKEGVIDQAEVFVAHGHADFAIHLMQEHLRDAPTESPVPWLLLLDLLQRNGNEAEYNTARSECQRHFNIQIPQLAALQAASGKGLEAYPHVLVRLEAVWRTAERDAFFHDLIYDHRGGTRLGFEPLAYRDILMLRAIAQETALPIAA